MANSLDHLSSRTRFEWLAGLNTEYRPAKAYRRTSIICTIGRKHTSAWLRSLLMVGNLGPKTNSAEKINILRKGE